MKTPGKRGLAIFVILTLLPMVFAAHSATSMTNYVPIYETQSTNITVLIANSISSTAAINEVDFTQNGFNITNIIPIFNWDVTNNNDTVFTTATSAISSWGSQNFGFSITAPLVDQNTTVNWSVTTTDTNSDSTTDTLQLEVLHDDTPPVILGTTPSQFILGKNDSFSVTANDPETGIAGAELFLSNCTSVFDNQTNESGIEYIPYQLDCANNICSQILDLSSWQEGPVCYTYNVSNNAREQMETGNLTTTIDRTAPSISIISPISGFLNITDVNLLFNAQERFGSPLNCNLDVNDNQYSIATNPGNYTYNVSLSDGIYSWNVSCSNEVDLIGNSSTNTFGVDTQPPNVTITVQNISNRGQNVIIDVQINDSGSGVNDDATQAEIVDTNGNATNISIVNGKITYPTTITTIPGTYAVEVTAADNLGHMASESKQFIIEESYNILLEVTPQRSDASTDNDTLYANITGSIVEDNGSIPQGPINIQEIATNETLNIDNETGAFNTQIEIPETAGLYTIIASFFNGISTFTQTANISVGPYCGDGIVEAGEQCDGSTTQTCSDYGYSQGTVSCTNTCTIDTSQCSNPPQHRSSGGSGGGYETYSSGGIIQSTQEPATTQGNINNGTIQQTQQTQSHQELAASNIAVNNQTIQTTTTVGKKKESTLGIGAAWAPFANLVSNTSLTTIIVLLAIALLLYVFGWREKEDNWDTYFKKYGHK